MFGGKKLDRIIDMLEGEDRAVKALEKRLDQVEDQNQILFDRLMAIDWERYATYKPDPVSERYIPAESPLAPDQDDANAGEMLEIEE